MTLHHVVVAGPRKQELLELLAAVGITVDPGPNRGDCQVVGVPKAREDQVALGPVVVMQQRGRDASRLGDVPRTHPLDPALSDHIARDAQDFALPIVSHSPLLTNRLVRSYAPRDPRSRQRRAFRARAEHPD